MRYIVRIEHELGAFIEQSGKNFGQSPGRGLIGKTGLMQMV